MRAIAISVCCFMLLCLSSGCNHKNRIGNRKALKLISKFVFSRWPKMDRNAKFSVREYMVTGLWENAHLQLFNLVQNEERGICWEANYFVYKDKVYFFSECPITSVVVNNDQVYYALLTSIPWETEIGSVYFVGDQLRYAKACTVSGYCLFVTKHNSVVGVEQGTPSRKINSWVNGTFVGTVQAIGSRVEFEKCGSFPVHKLRNELIPECNRWEPD